MSSPPSERHRGRVASAVAAVIVVALAAALGAPTAGADSISSARAQAHAAQLELNNLYMEEDKAVNAYDAAHSKLTDVNRRIRLNRIRLAIAKQNLAAARAQLAGLVVAAYKGDDSNAAMDVLGARSFTELVNRVDAISRSNRSQASLLHQVTVSEQEVVAKRALLRVERAQARKYVARTRSAKVRIEGLVSSQHTLIQSLNTKVRDLIAQRKQRLAAEARARAAAAAAAAAARANEPPVVTSPLPTPPTGPVPPASSVGEQAVQIAMGELGVPYLWGGASPAGFDCSGLTMWVYAQLGIHLDHYTGAQWDEGAPVPRDELAPGDLVFFEPDIGHVGMYIGNDQFIEAPHTGGVVQISSLSEPWYASEYDGARRVTG